ncbi:MAG: hypothetical protein NVV60_11115 [Luteimonas sp.]|nr:hypothetical protein [Luteimonas sp.]
MFAFHMRQLERAMASDGTPLAGSLRIAGGTVLGSPVVATAALQQEGSVGYLQAGTARIDVDQVVHPTVAPVLPVSEVAPVSGAVMNSVDVRASSPALPDGGRVAGELDAGTIARIDQWAAALHPDTFVADRSDVLESNLMRGRQFNRHFSQCRQTHGGVNTLQLRFAHPAAHIRSYQGMAQGCTFPAQPDDNVFGRITYADGSYWLGPVIASPQPQALALGAFGAMPGSVWLLVPAPAGKGEWGTPDGMRYQGEALPMALSAIFPDLWIQAPWGSFEMPQIDRAVTQQGVAYSGALRLEDGRLHADEARMRWRDGSEYLGELVGGTRCVAG